MNDTCDSVTTYSARAVDTFDVTFPLRAFGGFVQLGSMRSSVRQCRDCLQIPPDDSMATVSAVVRASLSSLETGAWSDLRGLRTIFCPAFSNVPSRSAHVLLSTGGVAPLWWIVGSIYGYAPREDKKCASDHRSRNLVILHLRPRLYQAAFIITARLQEKGEGDGR